jgi:hypothetical protein
MALSPFLTNFIESPQLALDKPFEPIVISWENAKIRIAFLKGIFFWEKYNHFLEPCQISSDNFKQICRGSGGLLRKGETAPSSGELE